MTAKKVVLKKEPLKEKEIKKVIPEYKSVFTKPIVIRKTTKIDLNYFGIRQYLKNKFKLDTFRKLKTEKKPEIKKESFDYKKYYEEMNQVILQWYNELDKRLSK